MNWKFPDTGQTAIPRGAVNQRWWNAPQIQDTQAREAQWRTELLKCPEASVGFSRSKPDKSLVEPKPKAWGSPPHTVPPDARSPEGEEAARTVRENLLQLLFQRMNPVVCDFVYPASLLVSRALPTKRPNRRNNPEHKKPELPHESNQALRSTSALKPQTGPQAGRGPRTSPDI